MFKRSSTLLVFLLLLHCCLLTQAQTPEGAPEDDAAAKRLAYMVGHATSFKGTRDSDKAKIIPLEKPLLRWTNPYSNVKDGVLVGWVDEIGRPMAVAQIYLLPNSESEWGIEAQSLSQESFVLRAEFNGPWRPRKPGIVWKPFPISSTKPAGSKALRLSQMRALARRFRGNDDFQEKSDSVLRLLTNPMIRYEDAKNNIIDGALFALVHGTDPEMLIQIELRANKQTKQQSYFYAIAPMTGYELRGYLDGTEVWHKPRTTASPETGVFWQRNLRDTKPPSFLEQLLSF